jgi:hypothetical protein
MKIGRDIFHRSQNHQVRGQRFFVWLWLLPALFAVKNVFASGFPSWTQTLELIQNSFTAHCQSSRCRFPLSSRRGLC